MLIHQITNLQNSQNNYLLITPTKSISLNSNYTITIAQITDLLTKLANYLLVSPTAAIALNSNYTMTTAQITDLNDYMTPYLTQSFAEDMISGMLASYMLKIPDKSTAINTKYTITQAQISDLNNQLAFYMLGSPQSQIPLNFSTAVNALLPNLGNTYLLANPSQEIQFNANYSLAAGQIPDFSSAVLAVLPSQLNNYMLLSPTRQLYLNPNYYVLTTNFQTNSINPNILINNSITATQLQPSCIQLSTLNSDLQQFFKFGYSYSSTDTFDAKNANVPYPCVTQQYNSTYPIGFLHTNYNKYNGHALNYQQSRTLQGYTYQNLKECGFNYVISDQQTMTDDFLQKQETAMIPYVIMGIKALNQNITDQDSKYQQLILDQQNQIEKINEKIDTINHAMIQSLNKIDEVSQQTDQKIQDVQQNSIINSINSDNIDDIKNTLNKLIYQFDQQQNVIKKYQTQIVFLQSQCEQMQSTIEKQQTDITSLKLKTKLTN
ncbi:hypothetical protein ABPG74_005745 [Tetrahymena malaccensis]